MALCHGPVSTLFPSPFPIRVPPRMIVLPCFPLSSSHPSWTSLTITLTEMTLLKFIVFGCLLNLVSLRMEVGENAQM